MSLVNLKPMKPILLLWGEGRWGWIRLGIDAHLMMSILESKTNREYASSHRHGGVSVVGMLRSDGETSREIPVGAKSLAVWTKATGVASWVTSEGALASWEVGAVRSSADTSVMAGGAKGPYLVDVNREVEDVRWLLGR